MVELVLQRILCKPLRWWRGLPHEPQRPSPRVPQVNSVRPYRPEVHKERSMNDVKHNGKGQHSSSDPMVGNPVKLDTYFRQESGKQQREHGSRHDPVKCTSSQRVPGDVLGDLGGEYGRSNGPELLRFREIPQVNRMDDNEEQSRDHRHPYQEPRNVDGDNLSPRIYCPL